MPKLDKIGKAGVRFKESLKELEKATKEKGDAADNLIRAMKQAKRYILQIEGYKFEYIHSGPKDNIKVQKPK